MKSEDPIRRIEAAIERESAQVASSFKEDGANNADSRFVSLELTRAINYWWWRASLTKREEDFVAAKTITRGFNPAMSMFMTSSIHSIGVPNAPSTRASSEWADNVLMKLGLLRLAQRVVDLERAGLIRFVDGTDEKLCFETIGSAGSGEDIDVRAQDWLKDLAISQDDAEYRDLQMSGNRIQSLLRQNVRVFEKYYIGYDTTPELDEHFHRLAILHARRSFGHEAFPRDADFGGTPYTIFAATAITLVGWSLKHMAFATELLAMKPRMEMRNLLVPWSPLKTKAGYMAAQLEIDEPVAHQVLDLFAANQEYFERFAPVHDAPTPIFVSAAHDFFHFSVSSAQLAPYDLLLRRLREQYADDYFRNVDQREQEFRQDLHQVLPMRRIHFARRAIQLRYDGKSVTDLDAVALVKSTGSLGLFQLKWQDPLGNDLRERRSRMTNLVPSANKWVRAVLDWIHLHGPETIINLAQFEGDVPEIRRVVLFIVGRYNCNYSGASPDPRAVWCNWPQLLRAVDTSGYVEDPVVALAEGIKRQGVWRPAQARPGSGKVRLRDFTIETSYSATAPD